MLTKLQQQPHLQPRPASAPAPSSAETPTSLDMSDRDFEKFMKTVTDIKADMITILADSFRAIAQAKQ